MTRALGWMDVVSTDLAAMSAFYRDIFGWTPTRSFDHHGGEYRMLAHDGHYPAGIEKISAEKGPARWTVFVVADDLKGVVDAAVAAGGGVSFQPAALDDLGIVAMITDPLGATLGVWQPGAFDPRGIPQLDGRFAGAELVTSDVERTRRFLTAVIGPDAGAVTAGKQGKWRPVLGVDSLEGTVAAISAAGGTARPARPDGVVEAIDPLGATFLLVQR
jgi:predicted enzyme related to lactoylglutathione lyase